MMAGQSSNQQEERRTRVEYFDKARLKEHTLQNGESVEGTIFFKLPANLENLKDAELSFWFIDKAANNGIRKTVDVSGINYRKLTPEELEVKAAEIKAKQEALESSDNVKEEEEF